MFPQDEMRESVMGIQKDHAQKLFSKIFCMLVCMFLLTSCAPGAQEAAPTDSLQVVEEPTATPLPTSTATPTATPTATATKTNTPTPTPTHIHAQNKIILHQADDEIIWDWFTYLPEELDRRKPIVIMLVGIHGNISNDYDKQREESLNLMNWATTWPGIENFALLTPVIPRTDQAYPVVFEYRSFSNPNEMYSRADEKVIKMINKFTDILVIDGYQVYPKVMISGFSAGANFATKFTLLHPDLVQGIAAGGLGGLFIFPEEEYEDILLDWPVGVNDLYELTGLEFNRESYKQVKQFIYYGDEDTGKNFNTFITPEYGTFGFWQSVSQMYFITEHFGTQDFERVQNQLLYLKSIGYDNLFFKIYHGIGHETPYMVIEDTMAFFINEAYPEEFSPTYRIEYPSPCQGEICGELLPLLPQQLPFTIDGKADDWADYQPVLTDKTGDSEAGSVMDFEALYMAQDDNYLYLMLKAGGQPGGEWESWEVDFEMDSGVENLCGGTEWHFIIWTDLPAGQLVVDSLDECEDNPGGQAYPGEYIWGDVLEVKILLAYLRNPSEIDIFHVKSYLSESEGSYIIPDEMN